SKSKTHFHEGDLMEEKKLRHFHCENCPNFTSAYGHIPECKKCDKKEMVENK
ncbi:hypothetical protein LCGC14_2499010, partial [marine sediment metagenome]